MPGAIAGIEVAESLNKTVHRFEIRRFQSAAGLDSAIWAVEAGIYAELFLVYHPLLPDVSEYALTSFFRGVDLVAVLDTKIVVTGIVVATTVLPYMT